ncbi:MAG: hypothetical protein ACSHWW_02830 [Nonlabens sp.]
MVIATAAMIAATVTVIGAILLFAGYVTAAIGWWAACDPCLSGRGYN